MTTQEAANSLSVYDTSVLEVVETIDGVRKQLNPIAKANPEKLSQALVQLAALNSLLGEHVANAEFNANMLESEYKFDREQIKLAKLKDGSTASEADSVKIVDSQDKVVAYNQAQYIYKLLAYKRKDTSEFIDALRSRLSFVKVEMKESQNV